jgi:hypothetical protein
MLSRWSRLQIRLASVSASNLPHHPSVVVAAFVGENFHQRPDNLICQPSQVEKVAKRAEANYPNRAARGRRNYRSSFRGRWRKVYAAAEAVLTRRPRRGSPVVLRELKDRSAKPFAFSTMQYMFSACAKPPWR